MKGGGNMKTKIKNLVYGLSLMVLIAPVLVSAADSKPGAVPSEANLSKATFLEVLTKFMNWLLGLVGVLGVIGFAISGIMYLTAAGDEGRIETAKKTMIWSIVGIVVALMGGIILTTVTGILGEGSK